MSKHSKHSEPETTTPQDDGTVAAAADAQPAADGQPDPAAQAKISAAAGARSGGDLLAELGALPAIGALDGIKANAQAGYYRTVPAEHLVTDLQALTFENEEHGKVRDALVERARGGAFSGAK